MSLSQSSNGVSSSHASTGTSQESILSLIDDELKGYRCWSHTRAFLSHFPPPPEGTDYRRVVAEFIPKDDNSRFCLKSIVPTWPLNGSKECLYYQPFTEILNKVIKAARAIYPSLLRREIAAYVYDKPMLDGVDGSSPLKPDCLVSAKQQDYARWADVDVAIEVKRRDRDLALQAASYGRALLAARPGRHQAHVITYNQETSMAVFNIYGRSCVSSTIGLRLESLSGFRNFVRIVLALLANLDAGYDESRDSDFILIPGGIVRIKETLENRTCVVGRATCVIKGEVVRLVDELHMKKEGTVSIELGALSHHRNGWEKPRSHKKKASASSNSSKSSSSLASIKEEAQNGNRMRALNTLVEHADECISEFKVSQKSGAKDSKFGGKGHGFLYPFRRTAVKSSYEFMGTGWRTLQLEETVVIKESWVPHYQACREETILNLIDGLWGAPKKHGAYQVFSNIPICPYPATAKTSTINDENVGQEVTEELEDFVSIAVPTSQGPASSNSGTITQEYLPPIRECRRIVFKTEGTPLIYVPDHPFLLRVIVDAIIAHYNCFRLGWLHADISYGNVLFVSKGQKQELPEMFTWLGWNRAYGLLIDYDYAERWDLPETVPKPKSGTPLYLSRRLYLAFEEGEDWERYPSDDLESLCWVFFFSILQMGKTANSLSTPERRWLDKLESASNASTMQSAKIAISYTLGRAIGFEKYTYTSLFLPLVVKWLDLVEMRSRALEYSGGFAKRKGVFRKRAEVIMEESEDLYLPLVKQVVELLDSIEKM